VISYECEEEVIVESIQREQESVKIESHKLVTSPSFEITAEKEQQEDERDLLEIRAYKLRKYLMKNVIPFLGEGLVEICKSQPENAVEYLVSLNERSSRNS